jgi:hypothetical protein
MILFVLESCHIRALCDLASLIQSWFDPTPKIGLGSSLLLPVLGPIDAKLVKSQRFTKHAKYFIQMIDKALGMLGLDIELLTEILLGDLGAKHVTPYHRLYSSMVAYGFKPEYFPSMGRALLHAAVKEREGAHYTDEVKDAWVEVYGALSYDMIRGQKQLKTKHRTGWSCSF